MQTWSPDGRPPLSRSRTRDLRRRRRVRGRDGDPTTARQGSEGSSEAGDGATPVRDHANDGVGFFAAMTHVQFAVVFLIGSLAGRSVVYLPGRS